MRQLDFGFTGPEPASTRRLFIGLVPDSQAQAAIDASRRDWRWSPRTRFTTAGRFHLTLLFHAACTGRDEIAFRRTLESIARHDLPAIDLALRPVPVWKNHVAVLRPDESGALHRLHDAIVGGGVEPIGAATHPVGTRWTPHFTLAHDACGSVPPPSGHAIECRVREVALVWSQLPPAFARARHVVLERVALSGD